MALGSPLPFGTPVIQYPGTPPPAMTSSLVAPFRAPVELGRVWPRFRGARQLAQLHRLERGLGRWIRVLPAVPMRRRTGR